jgi:very-short-patch-repair endonuclease
MWYHLRDRRLGGHKFRRQHRIGPFIVDFFCLDKSLIVELDGGQHATQVQKDTQRSEYLESRGHRIVRFWNNQVLNETQSVLETIVSMLQSNSPHPDPLPEGEGVEPSA